MPFQIEKEGSGTLCTACWRGTVTRDRGGVMRVWCAQMERTLHFQVKECTSFNDRNALDRYDYEKIAWIIDPSASGKIGFVRPGTEEHAKLRENG